MKRLNQFIFLALPMVLILCSCSNTDNANDNPPPTYTAWEAASSSDEFRSLFSEKLSEYAENISSFAEHTEEFYNEVQNGKSLSRNESYSELRDNLLAWNYGLDSYPEESVPDECLHIYDVYLPLSKYTAEFLHTTDGANSVSELESAYSSFLEKATYQIQVIREIPSREMLIGVWKDGETTVQFSPYGTFHVYAKYDKYDSYGTWRPVTEDDIEHPVQWNLEANGIDLTQLPAFYLIYDETGFVYNTEKYGPCMKRYSIVEEKDDGSLTFYESTKNLTLGTPDFCTYTLYSKHTTLPIPTNYNIETTETASEKYWCMGKNDTCQNKTTSPDDFFCDECDPDGDNIEG